MKPLKPMEAIQFREPMDPIKPMKPMEHIEPMKPLELIQKYSGRMYCVDWLWVEPNFIRSALTQSTLTLPVGAKCPVDKLSSRNPNADK